MVRRARQPLARGSPTAHRPTGHSDSCVVGVGLTKVLSEKLLSSSLSSIHILYNQALVDGLSVSYVPASSGFIIQHLLPGGEVGIAPRAEVG